MLKSAVNLNYLDFEQSIAELEEKILELQRIGNDSNIEIQEEIKKLHEKNRALTSSIFANLSDWQVVKIARHINRPQAMDYVNYIFKDFVELHGDRHFADDRAIICGIASLNGQSVVVIAQQKGCKTKDKILHNFGMPKPEGYRKALRIMKMAERFNLPIVTLIDTPGAYPGIDAEERNQSEAIAKNLFELSALKVPIICTVIGEGGSGGALAVGVGDKVMMLEYSIYSVISPEGCASILWKSAEKAKEASAALALTAKKLKSLNIIDRIVEEPLGGAHRDPNQTALNLKNVILEELNNLKDIPVDSLLEYRYQKLMQVGDFNEANS